MMNKLTLAMCGLALIVTLHTVGCGSRTDQNVGFTSITKGQELQDLDAARKKGLLTEKEYEKQKKQILKRK